jgi:hypothetical protein
MGPQGPKDVTGDTAQDPSGLVGEPASVVEENTWGQRLAIPKRIDDLWDLSVQGIWEAHLGGELAWADGADRAPRRDLRKDTAPGFPTTDRRSEGR